MPELSREWIANYFRRNRREKISRFVERIGDAIIQLSVWIRKPTCPCPLCNRNLDAMTDEAEWTCMELCYAEDQLDELWTERGLTTGESR